jgi:hypothetical protein
MILRTSAVHGKSEKFRGLLVTIQLYLSKCNGMTFNGLADSSFSTVKLHTPLEFECREIHGVSQYTSRNEYFLRR